MAFDTTKAYKVKRHEGVAWRFHSWPKKWEPQLTLCSDEDGNEWEEDTGEGEWVEEVDSDEANFYMVGDDQKFLFDLSQVEPISSEEYCHSCGQIGCGHDVR